MLLVAVLLVDGDAVAVAVAIAAAPILLWFAVCISALYVQNNYYSGN